MSAAQIETTVDELLALIGTKEVEIAQLRRVMQQQANKIAQLATENIRMAHAARDGQTNGEAGMVPAPTEAN